MQVDPNDLAALPPMALLVVALAAVLWFVWRAMQITKDMQKNALETGGQATVEALKAFRETQADQRTFYTAKLEDMRAGMNIMDGRVRDLEGQLENEKDRREDLERENKNKDRRIQELEEEVRDLRKRLDEKSKPKRVTKGKAGAVAAAGGDK